MILHEDKHFIVSQGFFSGWRVKSKINGSVSIPPPAVAEKMGLTWIKVRKSRHHSEVHWRRAEVILFHVFASSAYDPAGDDAAMFLGHSPETLAEWCFVQALKTLQEDGLRLDGRPAQPRPAAPLNATTVFRTSTLVHSYYAPTDEHFVTILATGERCVAKRAHANRLQDALRAAEFIFDEGQDRQLAEMQIRKAFCITVVSGEASPVGSLFMSQSPEVVAMAFGTMDKK